ncbi:uncharacterized protein LOC114732801 isoform X2 [Neltuma alba]|uniref:uncharacterized protein LOC114732801 isoform X2 n=1 Tax=Neltuma alba TaxID=207710 RepID=UPI0010A2D3CD|nr:uncharacterized protein LOC114732801 isoform X2 [Prosopis alba]XP_028775988.1 uncharacterized protein LOC114732801 isoform X2 [Prosopis alba]XP_028775989.1 uncharacterized protein LOC114732801 isoform X2 [Prosopis alba]
MGDKGEKSCPICTEEMDLTDQQLKPCKCGYEICVWCWHYIMEMAEKNGTEGRCPACRTPYDKERIVAMSANCQRLVAEMNLKEKKKMQKLKPKASDGRKHLSDVRVIQRNLVYIIGLPLNLADEDLLQRKEYFGRYGKVLKVSISRTATGVVQHSANNSCCVYITYSKEAEAVRCIQSVHCFMLDGKSLRACFGTTKYCHAWLRNLACSNRDCLYLHDYGSQEDSFTKDELVLAFARSRIQQIIGATNNLHRRSGNVLPPPADDPRHMLPAAKPAAKISLDKMENQVKVSCSSSGTGNNTSLPAVTSWVMRVSGTLPPHAGTQDSCNSLNRKVEASNDPQTIVTGVSNAERSTLNTRTSDGVIFEAPSNALLESSDFDQRDEGNMQTHESYVTKAGGLEKLPVDGMSNHETSVAVTGDGLDVVSRASRGFVEFSRSCDLNMDQAFRHNSNRDVQGLCSGLSSLNICSHVEDTYCTPGSGNIHFTSNSTDSFGRQRLMEENRYSAEQATWPARWEQIIVDDLLNLDCEQPKCSEGFNNLSSGVSSPGLPLNLEQSNHQVWKQDKVGHHSQPGKPSDYYDNGTGFDDKASPDMAESSIISNILSLEMDAWEDSLVKLLGESDEQCTSSKAPVLWKVQDKNQSRFSFARQDEFLNEASDFGHSFSTAGHAPSEYFSPGGFMANEDNLTGKGSHVLPSSSHGDSHVGSQSFISSTCSVSNAHSSTPPGFSASSRIPPGFSCGRVEKNYNASVRQLQGQYVPSSGNVGRIRDVEVSDPAILEFSEGKLAEKLNNSTLDMRQSFLSQFYPDEDDARLKLLMQQSQNLRFSQYVGDRFPPQNDSYTTSKLLDQFQPNNPSIYQQLHSQQFNTNMLSSNSLWDGWNDSRNFSGLVLPSSSKRLWRV